jgi:ribosomal protein L15
MQLHDVHKGIKRRKKRKRIGRGIGSGHGKTSSKGHKGHASRQGFKLDPLFEGGQMPLARRIPKRGFVNGAFKKSYAIVNLAALDERFASGTVVDEPSRGTISTASRFWEMASSPSRSKSTPPSSALRPLPRSHRPEERL